MSILEVPLRPTPEVARSQSKGTCVSYLLSWPRKDDELHCRSPRHQRTVLPLYLVHFVLLPQNDNSTELPDIMLGRFWAEAVVVTPGALESGCKGQMEISA